MPRGVVFALLAALLFGASTPFAKIIVVAVAPVTLAGLLYLGSGVGLLIVFLINSFRLRTTANVQASLTRLDLPWLGGAIVTGGIAAPVLLMIGLIHIPASTTALLLNLESVFTAALAWLVFKENVDRRVFLGMVLIVGAGVLLSWDQRPMSGVPWAALSVVGSCLCWAIDNNLTCKIAAGDAVQIAGLKGLVAGMVNLAIAWLLGLPYPEITMALFACLIGFFGYGLSLVLFVKALRELGTARTSAYFSSAPFVGAGISLFLFQESPDLLFWIATVVIGAGIGLHLSEIHRHGHSHEPIFHTHRHSHDEHHQHSHDDWNGERPHSHAHQHEPLSHSHAHFPDIHHRHRH
ncbi:MAG: EamA family transporter [Methylococcales bacterium]